MLYKWMPSHGWYYRAEEHDENEASHQMWELGALFQVRAYAAVGMHGCTGI